MLHIYVDRRSTCSLGFGYDVLGQGGLAGALRSKDFGDPATRDAVDAQGVVHSQRTRGDGLYLDWLVGQGHQDAPSFKSRGDLHRQVGQSTIGQCRVGCQGATLKARYRGSCPNHTRRT